MPLDELLESEKVKRVRQSNPGGFAVGASLGRDVGIGFVMTLIGGFYVLFRFSSIISQPFSRVWDWLLLGLPATLFLYSCIRVFVMFRHPKGDKAPFVHVDSLSSKGASLLRWSAFAIIFLTPIVALLYTAFTKQL